jgi:hypothetical protein
MGILLGNMEGGSFTGDFEGKYRRKLWRWAFLSLGAHWEPGELVDWEF